MTKNKTNWATAKHYAQVKKHLEKQTLDVNNTGYYTEILGANGLTVFVTDLKDWLAVQNTAAEKLVLEIEL
jgi:hypothetical protein